ncbi:Holliday junction resolvase [Carbonactinospora thermoautotrophica]|uniref:Putative pre-16S rRNA nuclease n=1 Tax=Carbonactinospora thermoautotrophica TaxID=1469144 RepID=A0A132NJP3_9ACTN|nr:Holliday junction resolvase RuvX [Carbonactinospora thermoautotrophica]KWX05392.1 Holliday junction resolvase [Carbonactinospora thermoautotrophica]KWX10314.1 Holliday junction resolvase [Carbonactinospora thermoautotrophica]
MRPAVRPGVRLGVDVGTVRIGVASCDPHGLLATPVETVRKGRGDLNRIARLVTELGAIEVVVGLPRSLSGREGPAAQAAREFAARLARRIAPVPVRLVDERLSTVTAQRGMHEVGVSSRKGRAVIDQAAAVVILQSALDAERTVGSPPGQIVQAGT